jgi:predicted dinucleotide-binding enzyme
MNIGILGTGNMSSRLGRIWLARGHHVFFGTRSVEKAAQLVAETQDNTISYQINRLFY